MTPLPASGRGGVRAWAPASVQCLPPATITAAVPVLLAVGWVTSPPPITPVPPPVRAAPSGAPNTPAAAPPPTAPPVPAAPPPPLPTDLAQMLFDVLAGLGAEITVR